ncbi:MAG TPA: hypothetical protein VF151_08475 [Gemmatimonadales bacterium]
MSEKKQPWLKWYPADWRADPALRMCSLAARGLWIEMLGFMHEAEPYGHLIIAGQRPTPDDLAALVGIAPATVRKALAELESRNVFSRTDDGTIYSRKMVRDKAKLERDRANGKRGGNPEVMTPDNGGVNPRDNEGVNPPDKAQKPEARSQNAAADARARDPRFHEVGQEVLRLCGDSPNLLNYGRVEAWLRAGADPELDIYPAIRTALAKRGKPPNSLNYFDGAVADAVARRTKPMPEGHGRRRADRYDDIADGIDDFTRRLNGFDAGPGDQGNHPLLPAAERREEFG